MVWLKIRSGHFVGDVRVPYTMTRDNLREDKVKIDACESTASAYQIAWNSRATASHVSDSRMDAKEVEIPRSLSPEPFVLHTQLTKGHVARLRGVSGDSEEKEELRGIDVPGNCSGSGGAVEAAMVARRKSCDQSRIDC